jgi:succinate-acetate transporter protein
VLGWSFMWHQMYCFFYQLNRILALGSEHVVLRMHVGRLWEVHSTNMICDRGLHSILLATSIPFRCLGDSKMVSKAGVTGNVSEGVFWLRGCLITAFSQLKHFQSFHDPARSVVFSFIFLCFFCFLLVLMNRNMVNTQGAQLLCGDEWDKHIKTASKTKGRAWKWSKLLGWS